MERGKQAGRVPRWLVIFENRGNWTMSLYDVRNLLKENDYSDSPSFVEKCVKEGTTLRTLGGIRFWIDETYREVKNG